MHRCGRGIGVAPPYCDVLGQSDSAASRTEQRGQPRMQASSLCDVAQCTCHATRCLAVVQPRMTTGPSVTSSAKHQAALREVRCAHASTVQRGIVD